MLRTLLLVGAAFVAGTLLAGDCGVSADGPEVVDTRRSEDATITRFSDGSQTAVFSPSRHVRAPDGTLESTLLEYRAVEGTRPVGGVHPVQGGDLFVLDTAPVRHQVDADGLAMTDPATGKGIKWEFPSPPRIEPDAANPRDRGKVAYVHAGLIWEYLATPAGAKLEARVAAAQGKTTYTMPYSLVGTDQPLKADGRGLAGDGFRVAPVVLVDANGQRYPAGEYTVTPTEISFTVDDSVIPAGAYPYIIDPTTTFEVGAGDEDAYISKQGTSYPPDGDSGTEFNTAGNALVVRKLQTAGNVFNNVSVVIAWDTSSLPSDAIIESATLTINVTSLTDSNNRGLVVDWYSGVPPISNSDYDDLGNGTAGTFLLADLSVASHDLELPVGANTISTTDFTSVRLTISGDGPPGAGDTNEVQIESFDAAGTDEPQLSITFTTPLAETEPAIDPDGLGVNAYQNVVESGDFLVVAPYQIAFDTLPSELASNEYQAIFRDGTNYLQTVNPVSTSENALQGFGDGATAFYFTAQQASDLGIVWNSPGTYTVNLDAVNGTQTASNSAVTFRAGSNEALVEDIRTLAQALESAWGIDLISGGVFTGTGQSYFQAVIPLLSEMVPELMESRVVRGDIEQPTQPGTGTASSFADFWSGTDTGAGFSALGSMWGMNSMTARTVVALVIAAAVAIAAIVMGAPAQYGLLAGAVVLILAPVIGLGPLAMSFFIGFVGLFLAVYIFWMRRAV